MHLLLLEDDIDLGQAVAEHLEAQGHEVSWMKLCSQADQCMRRPDIARHSSTCACPMATAWSCSSNGESVATSAL